jgi:hypothetical protein
VAGDEAEARAGARAGPGEAPRGGGEEEAAVVGARDGGGCGGRGDGGHGDPGAARRRSVLGMGKRSCGGGLVVRGCRVWMRGGPRLGQVDRFFFFVGFNFHVYYSYVSLRKKSILPSTYGTVSITPELSKNGQITPWSSFETLH